MSVTLGATGGGIRAVDRRRLGGTASREHHDGLARDGSQDHEYLTPELADKTTWAGTGGRRRTSEGGRAGAGAGRSARATETPAGAAGGAGAGESAQASRTPAGASGQAGPRAGESA